MSSSSSSSSYPSLSFQPICPNGSKFFACTTGTKFIGCCTTTLNPCTTSSGCAPPNLKAASFSPDAYGTFPDQECPAGSLWYTCKETRPPFWGCCRVNACAERGCVGGLGGNLSEAFLSSNSNVAAAFLSMVESSYSASTALAATTSLIAGTSATASSSSSSVAAATTSTTAPPMTTTSSSTSKNTTRNIGAIVGGTVAGVAVVVAFLLVLFFLYRCRKAAATTAVAATATAAADGGGGGGGGTPMSIISHQQSPFNTQQMLDNNQNTHPALRKPETSPVAAVEEQGFKQSVPNMGESQFEAYKPQKYHHTLPPPAFPIYNVLNRNPPIRTPPPPPPQPPSYIISEIEGTPVFNSSPAPPAFNTFPPTPPIRAYSEIASSERDTRAELEGDSPTKPAGGREMEEKNKEKRMMMIMGAK